ncbi:unnamed protein product [Rotaria magnacalcarata]|uniref:F-box domain-containing protein n=2 Tax=Rotaria magnacalcarata TaxID=392030 RepID=A0A816UII6_9BILA|nr:unnamed protein product [Rotaria magnacalcarata]
MTMYISYLDRLPVEILHHILDNLDTQTILFSFRFACKRFHSIANSYNYYDFNFESISKTKFLHMCCIIPFEQVVALTLSDKDNTHGQIKVFNSLFNINQFIRLRSLTLIQIETHDLKVFLNYAIRSSLLFLSIDCQTTRIHEENTALNLISSTIEHCSLKKLNLSMRPKDMKELQWPLNLTISYLRIKNSITCDQFYTILQHSPCLQTIILKDFNVDDTSEKNLPCFNHAPFLQIKSLTCEDGRIQINKLEQCLTLTPALVYLKLIGCGNLFCSTFDGYRWEQLIKNKLPLLEKFDFLISAFTHVNFDTSSVEQMISSFRTSFWVDEKHCLVTCDYIICSHKLLLYTLPLCTDHFVYYNTDTRKVSAKNFTLTNNYSTMMDNAKKLHLHLTKFSNVDEIDKVNHLLFRNVTAPTIATNGGWPDDSFRFFSTIIDLSPIETLSLSIRFIDEYTPIIVHNINQALKCSPNIYVLSLHNLWSADNFASTVETIYSMITPNIKYLDIRVQNSDDVKFIIENFENLKDITFEYVQNLILNRGKFIEVLSDMKRHVSRWESHCAFHVWLDKA